MVSDFRINKPFFCLAVVLLLFCLGYSQDDTSRIKGQLALGVNSPSSNGFVTDYKGKTLNFPTVDLGLQYMFKPKLGGRLNYSFSRISNQEDTPSFKVNYARVNALLVYDANDIFSFLPSRMGVFFQAGPGYSFVKPLDNYTQNKISFFNIMAGAQFHYGISNTLSIFTDVSYVNGFAKDFNPVSKGFGSFNGNVLAVTFGASISLSGCYFCN